jgi:hypothetical protein
MVTASADAVMRMLESINAVTLKSSRFCLRALDEDASGTGVENNHLS